MIRRKSTRPATAANAANGNQVAPANPKSASAAPPPGSIPPGGDEPTPMVIDELMAAFSVDEGTVEPPPPRPPVDIDSPDVAELLGIPADGAVEPSTRAAPSTRALSPAQVVEHVGEHVGSAPPEPAQAPELVPEPTSRSTRRSRKEAKREAKREKKRLAEHEKAQKKSRKQTAKARRKARRQGEVDSSRFAGPPSESDVRILNPDDPTVPPIVPPATPAAAQPQPPSQPPSQPAGASIQIAGDDLPDAVYIEGDLGGGGSAATGPSGRPTVFIDEDRSHADVVTMDVATSATRMEPRIRDRRIAVRRAIGRRRLKWIAVVSGVLLLAVAAFAVLGSSLFEITTVRIEGRVYSGGQRFDAVVERIEGSNVLRVDTERLERELKRIPWVEDARVTTDFPNGATIEVRERTPSIAYQGPDGQYRVLDRDGRVLDVIAGQPVEYLELFVTGRPADLQPGQMGPPGYRAAATLVQALTPDMRARVQSLSADAEATDLRMLLDAPVGEGVVEVRFGAAEDLVDRLVRLQTVLTDPDPERVPTEMIDVSGPDLIIR